MGVLIGALLISRTGRTTELAMTHTDTTDAVRKCIEHIEAYRIHKGMPKDKFLAAFPGKCTELSESNVGSFPSREDLQQNHCYTVVLRTDTADNTWRSWVLQAKFSKASGFCSDFWLTTNP